MRSNVIKDPSPGCLARRKYVADRIRRGICVNCPKKVGPKRKGKTLCQTCQNRFNLRTKLWLRTHKEHRGKYEAAYRQRLWNETFDHYGRECFCCGDDYPQALQIDHIKGGGRKHFRLLNRHGSSFYAWLRDNGWPEGYRTLCCYCNFVRGRRGNKEHACNPKHRNWNK